MVGLVANTLAPEPVSSVNAVANWAEVNEPKEAALPTDVTIPVRLAFVTTVAALPTEVTPPVKLALVTTVAELPTLVTPPVKLALVVTLPAVRPDAVPVQLVSIPLVGVPSRGVTRVGDVAKAFAPLPVLVVTPVPPLATARVPPRVIAPEVAVFGVNPVVLPLNVVTPPDAAAHDGATPAPPEVNT